MTQRAPDAALLERVRQFEARLQSQEQERAELVSSLEKERTEQVAKHQDLEDKLRAAALQTLPTRDDTRVQIAAAEQESRVLWEKLRGCLSRASSRSDRSKRVWPSNLRRYRASVTSWPLASRRSRENVMS